MPDPTLPPDEAAAAGRRTPIVALAHSAAALDPGATVAASVRARHLLVAPDSAHMIKQMRADDARQKKSFLLLYYREKNAVYFRPPNTQHADI